jgi:hypothetical protein
MSLSEQQIAELHDLLWELRAGTASASEMTRLEQLVCEDPEVRAFYVRYMHLCADLHWNFAAQLEDASETPATPPITFPTAGIPYISPIPFGEPVPVAPTLSGFPPVLFSYLVAAAILGVAMLVGWVWRISENTQIAQHSSPDAASPNTAAPDEKKQWVGRVVDSFDCRWADPKTETFDGAKVPVGRKYALASGLMKISYDTGATIILEGPCTYVVESESRGFLSLGKLTARVDSRAKSGKQKADDRERRGAVSPIPKSELFSVRTPTAIVTDLGTEFGVEVDESGSSHTQVFLGKVEVQTVDAGNPETVSLGANESVRVESGRGNGASIIHQAGNAGSFVRKMPAATPVKLFNTGLDLKVGESDPHWQLAARSDDPTFKPLGTVVVRPISKSMANNPSRSQWVSPAGNTSLPEDVVYVFRTTFDLGNVSASRAVLRCKCIGDDRVIAVRLNGKRLKLPLAHDGEPFFYWTTFSAAAGFVQGANVLEVDVLNANPTLPSGQRRSMHSPVCLRVEVDD